MINFGKEKLLNSNLKYMCCTGFVSGLILCWVRNKFDTSCLVLIVLMWNFNCTKVQCSFFYWKLITCAMYSYNFSLEFKSSWGDLYNVFPTCFFCVYIMSLIFNTNDSQFSNYVHLCCWVVFGEMTTYFSECLIKLTKVWLFLQNKLNQIWT